MTGQSTSGAYRPAVLCISLSIVLSVLDGAMVQVALPTLSREFAVGDARSVMLLQAYQLALVVALVPCAALGDFIGHRNVMRAGLAVHLAGAIGCFLAPGWAWLIVFRVLQGLGAAAIVGVGNALTRHVWPPEVFGRAIGFNGSIVAASTALAPIAAGTILAQWDWHGLFAVQIPLALATLALAARTLPDNARATHGFDWSGALISGAGLAALVLGVGAIGRSGQAAFAIASSCVGILLLAWTIRAQWSHPGPLLPLDLLRKRPIALGSAASFTSFCGQATFFVVLPFHLTARGLDLPTIGLIIAFWPAAIACAARFAGAHADRSASPLPGVLGLLIAAAMLHSLHDLPLDAGVFDYGWRLALGGLGIVMFQTPNTRAISTGAPLARAGAAGGLIATLRLSGQTFGAALAAVLLQWPVGTAWQAAAWITPAILLVAAGCTLLRARSAYRQNP